MSAQSVFRSIFSWLIVSLLSAAFPLVAAGAEPDASLYLRAGGGIALSQDTQFADTDCSSTSPAALFGCGQGNDGRAIGVYGDFSNSAVWEIGMGYRWSDWLRTEFSLAYRPGFELNGKSNFIQLSPDLSQEVAADVTSLSGLVVCLIKPLTLLGVQEWIVSPIVTAGAGFSHNRIDSMVFTFPETLTITPDGTYTDFSWTVGAGFSYALSATCNIELLYRYVDLGQVRTDEGIMTIVKRSTQTIVNNSIQLAETKADLESNEVMLSVVWYF